MKKVESDGFSKPGDIPKGPSTSDKSQRLGSTAVEYETPAGHAGLGVTYPLHASTQPTRGAVLLLQQEDMDVVLLAARLAQDASGLTAAIIQAFERNHVSSFLSPSSN